MCGSDARGDNWQCGVLSDDVGRTVRYRQVGYEPDPAIRKDPEVMAGFNEQTLFAVADDNGGRSHPRSRPRRWHPRHQSPLQQLPCLAPGARTDRLAFTRRLPGLPARLPSLWRRHRDNSFCRKHMARSSFDPGPNLGAPTCC